MNASSPIPTARRTIPKVSANPGQRERIYKAKLTGGGPQDGLSSRLTALPGHIEYTGSGGVTARYELDADSLDERGLPLGEFVYYRYAPPIAAPA